MFVHLHRPGPPLDRFVEVVTYFEGYQPAHRKERVLPDGAVEIIVDLTDSPKKLFDRTDLRRFRDFERAWISGLRSDWIVIEAAPDTSLAVIRFRPGGAFPFLGFSVDDLTNVVEDLDDVLRGSVAALRDRILAAQTLPDKMRAIDAWLLARARGRLEIHPAIEHLTQRLLAPAGNSLADVLAEVGYSRRHISQLFRQWVGIPPKHYFRIRRFQQVLRTVARRGSAEPPCLEELELRASAPAAPDWAEVAADHGYYDQAHLIHEFREFAGLTPGEYVAAFRGLENYLPQD